MNFNRVILGGNLTRDPERRVTPTGMAITKFAIAINRKYKDRDDQLKEQTTFVEITAFGRQADTIAERFTKGMPIFLEGRLNLSQWETQEGDKRSKLDVVLEGFQFVGPPAAEGGSGYSRQAPARSNQDNTYTPSRAAQNALDDPGGALDDDDVPF